MRSIIDHRKFTHFSYIFALIYIFYSLFFVLALSEIDIDDWWKPKIHRGSCVLPRTVKKVQVHVIFDKYANNRITKPYNRIFLWLLFGATSVIYFSKFVGSFFVALSTCITYTYMYIISKSVENILCTMNTNQNKWTDHLFQFIWSAAAEKTPKNHERQSEHQFPLNCLIWNMRYSTPIKLMSPSCCAAFREMQVAIFLLFQILSPSLVHKHTLFGLKQV